MAETRPDRVRGLPHDEFWAFCDQSELRLQRCESCDKLLWPVMRSCEQCGGEGFRWDLMSGRGKLASWCSFHHDYYRGMLALPNDVILVELDEGPLFVSNPKGFTEAEASIDMVVRCEFVDCADSIGPFRLPVFARS